MVTKYWWFSVSLLPTPLFSKELKMPAFKLHKYFPMLWHGNLHEGEGYYQHRGDCAGELYLLFKMCCGIGNSSAGPGQRDRGGFSSHELRLRGDGHGNYCLWHAQVSKGGKPPCSHIGVGHRVSSVCARTRTSWDCSHEASWETFMQAMS